MRRRLFPQRLRIDWFMYVESDGRCRVEDFLDGLDMRQRGELTGQMAAFAREGTWDDPDVVGFIRTLEGLPVSQRVLELERRRNKIIFFPDGTDALAVLGFTETTRSAKDVLLAEAVSLIEAAAAISKKGIVS